MCVNQSTRLLQLWKIDRSIFTNFRCQYTTTCLMLNRHSISKSDKSLSRRRSRKKWVGSTFESHADIDDGTWSFSEIDNSSEAESFSLKEQVERNRRAFVKSKIIERKHFREPVQANILSWRAKTQLCDLYEQHGDEDEILRLFPVTPEALRKILHNKVRMLDEKTIQQHDKAVKHRWRSLLKQESCEPSVQRTLEALRDSGQITNIKNADGIDSLGYSKPQTMLELATTFPVRGEFGLLYEKIAKEVGSLGIHSSQDSIKKLPGLEETRSDNTESVKGITHHELLNELHTKLDILLKALESLIENHFTENLEGGTPPEFASFCSPTPSPSVNCHILSKSLADLIDFYFPMHNERRTHWFRDGLIGLGVGVLYGTTNVMVGHPFDTIKTKMQAQRGFENFSMLRTLTTTLKQQGIVGLYRGCVPPLWGSGIYRSAQFAVFEASYTHMNTSFGMTEIPGTGGVQIRVIMSGLLASTVRATIECPLEYAKVRRQLNQTWTLRSVYTGYGVTWIRTNGLMTSYFIMVDSIRRHYPDHFNKPLLGPFLTSGCAATLAWWIVWPLEVMKSRIQGGYDDKNQSLLSRIRSTVKEKGGFLALYRGIGPGTIRSFLANGTSMIVMVQAQKKVTQWGWRGEDDSLEEERED